MDLLLANTNSRGRITSHRTWTHRVERYLQETTCNNNTNPKQIQEEAIVADQFHGGRALKDCNSPIHVTNSAKSMVIAIVNNQEEIRNEFLLQDLLLSQLQKSLKLFSPESSWNKNPSPGRMINDSAPYQQDEDSYLLHPYLGSAFYGLMFLFHFEKSLICR